MSSTEPPAGSVPPPDGSVPPAAPPPPPPPPVTPENPVTMPPPSAGAVPPPPPPPTPSMGMPGASAGVGQPGNLVDRFLAALIDGIIIAIPSAIVQFIFQAAISYWVGIFFGGVIGAVLALGYFGYMESNRGATIGKGVMKLKVVGPDGHSNPTMNEAIKRHIYWALDIIPCLGPLAALVAIIMVAVGINSDTVNRQHFFDKFAGGTKVIKVG